MALIISPVRTLVKTTLGLAWKGIQGGVAWFMSKKVSDKLEELEKTYYPPEEEKAEEKPEQEKPVKRRRRKKQSDKSDYCDDRR